MIRVYSFKTKGDQAELSLLNQLKLVDLFSGELNTGASNHRIDLSVYFHGTYKIIGAAWQMPVCIYRWFLHFMKLFQIENPCSEEWAKMRPNNLGSFCYSCQKNVVDFTRQTKAEIISFFQENSRKSICGRFGKQQLEQLNADYTNWENQNAEIFRSKFVLALLLVFGLSLFSCKGPEQFFQEPFAETEIQISDSLNADSDVGISELFATDSISKDNFADSITNSTFPTPTVQLQSTIRFIEDDYGYPPFIMGDIIMWPSPSCIAAEEETSLTLDFKLPMNELESILGATSFEAELSQSVNTESKKQLTFTNYREGFVSIILRTEKGNELVKIWNGNLPAGKHVFEVDLYSYDSGFYFICIYHEDTEKILPIPFENKTI